ncbi:MAG: AmmeMemoRadiSam system radical SAM enzyme [Candidatus Margulisiibacteriota bacterium]
MKEALFYKQLSDGKVQCVLCPWDCKIASNKFGICGARKNVGGKLYSLIYAKVSSMAVDPIEKKPLYHFHPGTKVLSVGTYGCNMRCGHCQNWQIAHVKEIERQQGQDVSPARLVEIARETNSSGIAWTYNEPTIWFEYAYDSAMLAKKAGLYTVWVTNGYINLDALDMIGSYLDAYRVDIKGFSEDFYSKLTGVRNFKPILAAAERAQKKWDMHVEIITLVIPTMNDDDEQLNGIARWIVETLGPDTVWHLNRFLPCLDFRHLPPTPLPTLEKAKALGQAAGLKNVYIGNIL